MPTKHKKREIPELEVNKLDKTTEKRFSNLIKSSGIKNFNKNIEVWTSSGSNKALAYLSHGIFRYFGKFPPPIARYLIKEYTNSNDLVIDPMCGSGTTALEAMLLNRRSHCYDINPLSVLLSKVKITKVNKQKYLMELNKVIQTSKKCKNNSEQLIGLKNASHWFLPETIESLSSIKHSINQLKTTKDIKEALMIAFLSTVRRVSRATTQQGRLFLDIETAEKDALPFFEKKAKDIIESLSMLPEHTSQIKIWQKSILDKTDDPIEPAKLIICHPPYFNSYKYSGVNSLELAWLGVNHAEIRKDEVRESFKVGKTEKVKEYVDDMENGLRNISSYLQKNGRLALMIGDTVIRGTYIPVTNMLLDRLSDLYLVEKIALRIPQFTEASWAASQRRSGKQVGINLCDLMIIMRKK